MSNPKVLIQFDSDQHPSVFDSIVAIDSGVDHLLTFGQVEPVDVRELIHGAMFTRGGDSLRNTAVFIGGSRVDSAQQVLRSVVDCFFGPVRVSVMLDANGANTTAAAAVICLQRHMSLQGKTVGVLAATGSVGQRVSRILGNQGATVRVGSRQMDRASRLCERLRESGDSLQFEPFETDGPHQLETMVNGCDALISAGAAGVQLLRDDQWTSPDQLAVAIDLNAVPPAGIQGVEVAASGDEFKGTVVYGAIGVGNLKMKIHKQSIRQLFESSDQVLDVDEIFGIGQQIDANLQV